MSLCSKILRHQYKNLLNTDFLCKRFVSTNYESIIEKRNELFNQEVKRQRANVGRIEKIEVRYLGLPEDTTLIMNKGISTPYNCAQHLSEGHCNRSALALIDGSTPWDMHRPIQESCTLQLLNFMISDPHIVNKTFWRTCSFMLGAALHECFKEEAGLELHSFPGPNVKSGSFVHDIVLSVRGWKPTPQELRTISAEMIKLSGKNLKIERLEVHHDLALEMFKDSRFKREQLPSISFQTQGKVTLYRVGKHIDISRGPMISNTQLLGRCTISEVHEITENQNGSAESAAKGTTTNEGIYRVQGVALPTGIIINHFAYNILEERSKKLNLARLPNEPFEEHMVN